MSPEAQRIAIAEECGWRLEKMPDFDAFYSPAGHYVGGATHDMAKAINNAGVPDYLNDLNAMHDAEKVLTSKQWEDYPDYLEAVCHCDGWEIMGFKERRAMISATAAQRAEAFLKTLNLWQDQ